MASTCQRCGKENETGTRYCGQCGFDMTSGATMQTPLDPTMTSASAGPPKDPLIGKEVGGCVVESKIGQGGMGAVYRGMQTSLDRPVAIKVLPGHLAQNALYIKRFLREAKMVASIKHPNIVSVIDRGQAGELYYFVMEFIEGRTVSQVIMERGSLNPGDALEITRQAALALATAAEEGIIHRDIKPDNIMIDKGGVVKVTDFGLVKNTTETTGGITAPQQVMGTPAFMSPEQCEGEEVDHRSDIYSLGMTLYTMLTGGPAFQATTPLALLRKHLDEMPVPVHDRNPGVPSSVWPVLNRMLAKKADDRYPDWDSVLEALESLREGNLKDYSTTGLLHRKGSKRVTPGGQRASALTTLKESSDAGKLASEAETKLSPSSIPTPTAEPQTFKLETPVTPVGETSAPVPPKKKRIYITCAVSVAALVVVLTAVFMGPGFLTSSQPGPASSKTPEPEPDPAQEEYLKNLEEGRKAIDEERWADAVAVLQEAISENASGVAQDLLETAKNGVQFQELLDQGENAIKEERLADAEKALQAALEIKNSARARKLLDSVEAKSAEPAKSFENSIGMKFVLIPAGEFMMGSPDTEAGRGEDEKQHKVKITQSFYMQTTEVTQLQWKAIMETNASKFEGDNLPVENVNWNEAQEFIRKLSQKDGRQYRLPTEAEWEFACRGGTVSPFHFGEVLTPDLANFNGKYPYGPVPKGVFREKTTPVRTFSPNKWGLYDMHGNVWEWCRDWYGKDYFDESPEEDPQGPAGGRFRVLHGGSWFGGGIYCRSAKRRFCVPTHKSPEIGFRICLPVSGR